MIVSVDTVQLLAGNGGAVVNTPDEDVTGEVPIGAVPNGPLGDEDGAAVPLLFSLVSVPVEVLLAGAVGAKLVMLTGAEGRRLDGAVGRTDVPFVGIDGRPLLSVAGKVVVMTVVMTFVPLVYVVVYVPIRGALDGVKPNGRLLDAVMPADETGGT